MSTATSHDEHHDDHDHGPEPGLMRWVYTTNHKDIGTLYLLFALVMFFLGGAMAMVIRAELFQPGLQVTDPHFFNQMTTVHALVMIFGAVMPLDLAVRVRDAACRFLPARWCASRRLDDVSATRAANR
jgi:cytochrome c oxidase subunit 1